MKLAIVIPVYNNFSEYTKQCLADLNQLPEEHQIILVDNASKDDTKKLISKDRFHVIVNKENLGFAKACNIGYLKAKELGAENVMFLNNDIRVREDHSFWTDDIIEESEKGKLVGPTIGQLNAELNFVQETNSPKILDKNNIYVSGWNITAKIDIWEKLRIPEYIGPFSEEFGLAFFEDTDLGFRAKELGIEFSVVPVPVHHYGHKTANKLNTGELYLKAREIFVKKWGKK